MDVCSGNDCLKNCADNCTLNCNIGDTLCQNPECSCNINGCSKCMNGYWKLNYDYPCISCTNTFNNCLKCQDFIGCVICETGFILRNTTYNEKTVYYCQSNNATDIILDINENEPQKLDGLWIMLIFGVGLVATIAIYWFGGICYKCMK